MEKFCRNCGKEFKDEEKFCMQCGTKRAGQQTVKNTYNAESQIIKEQCVAPTAPQPGVTNTKGGSKAKLVAIISAIALVIVATVVALLVFNPFGGEDGNSEDDKASSYTTPIELYANLVEGDSSAVGKMIPEECWEHIEREYAEKDGYDESVDLKDQFENSIVRNKTIREQQFGENYSVSYEIIEERNLSDDELDEMRAAIESRYNIQKKVITEGKYLICEFKIEGNKNTDVERENMCVIKIDSNWYLFDNDGNCFYGMD